MAEDVVCEECKCINDNGIKKCWFCGNNLGGSYDNQQGLYASDESWEELESIFIGKAK